MFAGKIAGDIKKQTCVSEERHERSTFCRWTTSFSSIRWINTSTSSLSNKQFFILQLAVANVSFPACAALLAARPFWHGGGFSMMGSRNQGGCKTISESSDWKRGGPFVLHRSCVKVLLGRGLETLRSVVGSVGGQDQWLMSLHYGRHEWASPVRCYLSLPMPDQACAGASTLGAVCVKHRTKLVFVTHN